MAEESCTASSDNVERAVTALYELISKQREKNSSKEKKLFNDEPADISVTIHLKKALDGDDRGWKRSLIRLPYCPSGKNCTVCLIVKDDRRGRRAEDDKTIQDFKEMLQAERARVNEVMPLHVLKTEYNTFNLKRNLTLSYDKFLADERIQMYLPKLLGNKFIMSKKWPIPVCLSKSNVKERIDKALRTICILWMRQKAKYSLVIGNENMKKSSTVDNILSLMNQLPRVVPGGWDNVKSIYVSCLHVKPPIPAYISTTPSNDINFDSFFKSKEVFGPMSLSTFSKCKILITEDGDIMKLE